MLHFSRWKILAILGVCLFGLLGSLPNFFSKDDVEKWPGFLPQNQIGLGLDLQGGAHLLLAMDSRELRNKWLKTIARDARAKLRAAKIFYKGRPAVAGDVVRVRVAKPEELDKAIAGSIRGLCANWQLVEKMLLAAGPDLTPDSLRAGAESLGPFELPANFAASMGPDDHSASDAVRLFEYDPDAAVFVPAGDPVVAG